MTIRLTVLLLGITLAGVSGADSGRALELDELIDLSTEIVVGEVVGSTSRWQQRMVVTDTVVRVEETMKGAAAGEVTITQPGGTAVHPRLGASVTTQASTFTAMDAGETVVLFVDRRAGIRTLVGAQQGKLVVAPLAATHGERRALAVGPKRLQAEPDAPRGTIGTRGMTLDELRARVTARKGPVP
jgi:hypothetical protein